MVKRNEIRPIDNAAEAMANLVKSSRETVLDNFRLVLLGSPGSGKTTTSLTASEYCPIHLPAKEWTDLDDLFVLVYDCGGLDTASSWKLNVPYVDLSTINMHEIKKVEDQALGVLKERVRNGVTKTVVISSITSRSKVILSEYSSKVSNTMQLYNVILKEQIEFFQKLRNLPCNLVIEAHGKNVSVFDTKDNPQAAENARKALVAQGLKEGDIRMDIDGSAHAYYRANVSMILPTTLKGGRNNKVCNVWPYGAEGFESKCRFVGLDNPEPAQLQELFKKIKQHNEQ